MERKIVAVAPDAHIELEIGGPLTLKGWDRDEVRIDVTDPDQLQTEEREGGLYIQCGIGLSLAVPESSSIVADQIGGSATVKNIYGDIKIGDVGGSLTLKMANEVRVDSVGGSANVKAIDGNLSLGTVGGSLNVRAIDGDVSVDEVAGSTNLKALEGNLTVREARGTVNLRDVGPDVDILTHGNASIQLNSLDHGEYRIHSKGNVFCKLRTADNAEVSLHSGAGVIHIQSEDSNQSLHSRDHNLTFGDGEGRLEIDAAGTITLDTRASGGSISLDIEFDEELAEGWEEFADDISEQISGQMEGQLEELNKKLELMRERLHKSTDRGLRQAERQIERAQRRLHRKLATPRPPRPPRPPVRVKKSDPVSEAERLSVLQMVQKKQISVDEAEMLLNALEGKPYKASAVEPEAATEPAAEAASEMEEGDNE
jgi:DUF4097 and DUF4098 domain-containing protein YvlB